MKPPKPTPVGILVTVLALLSMTTGLWAHHSFAAQFDTEKVVTLQGRIESVQWGNPHVTIEIQAVDADKLLRWRLEAESPTALQANGITRQTFRRGDVITACGYLARLPGSDGVSLVAAEQITLANGRRLIVASYGGTKTCQQGNSAITAAQPAPSGIAGGITPMTASPAGRIETSPIQLFVAAPVEGFVTAPVQPFNTSPVQPLTSPPVGPFVAQQPAKLTRGAPPRMPSDALELGFLDLYDHDKPVPLTGKVTRVDWLHPNTYVFLTASGGNWVVESSFIQLQQASVSPGIRVGDVIAVNGYLPKDNPAAPLPARTHAAAASYLRTNRLIRAGEITIFSGQKLAVGEPPTQEERATRLAQCVALGC